MKKISRKKIVFEEGEKEWFVENYSKMSRKECANKLGISLKFLRKLSKELNIDKVYDTIDLPNEVWLPISGWEEAYAVSNMGRVKSLSRLITSRSPDSPFISKERILSPRVCGKDREYLSVSFHFNGKHKQYKIHRLVCAMFVPNPNGYKEVNHINEDKSDNRAENLEWCSRSYNVNYGRRIEKQRKNLCKGVYMLDDSRNIIKEFDSLIDAARCVHAHASNIGRACSNMKWKCSGYYWSFKQDYDKQ